MNGTPPATASRRILNLARLGLPPKAPFILLTYVLLGWNALWLAQVPRVGVANNGDYWRVMRPAGIEALEGHGMDGRFLDPFYRVRPPNLLSGGSAPALLAWLARAAGAESGQLDLRWMGAVYLSLLVLIVTAALVAGAAPAAVFLALLVLSDSTYLSFFNSFYADAALFVSLFGLVGWFLAAEKVRVAGGRWISCLSVTALCLLGGVSKAQYAILPAVVLFVLIAMQLAERRRPTLPGAVCLAMVSGFAVLAPWWFLKGPGPHFPQVNRYHALYAGVLVFTDRPERTLQRLDVPKAFWSSPRRDVFGAGIPRDAPVHSAIQHVSTLDLLGAYVRDPRALVRALQRASEELAAPRSHRRGTRERGVGPYAESPRWLDLSRGRANLWPQAPWLSMLLVLGGGVLFVSEAAARRLTGTGLAVFLLSTWVCAQTAVVLLGDGTVSLRQHLISARLAVDLLAVLVVYRATSWTFHGEPPPSSRDHRVSDLASSTS